MENTKNQMQAGLRPEGNSPAPGEVEKGLIDILEIIADALYREDIITTGEMNYIEQILRKLKVRVGSKKKEA